MKKIFLLITFILCLNAFSQNVTIKGAFDRPDAKRKLSLSRPMNSTQFPEINDLEEIAVNKGVFTIALTVQQPEIMYLNSYLNDSVEFSQPLFFKKGYTLTIDCKARNGKPQLTITGKGAPDNQPWEGSGNIIDFNDYPKDTLPERILADLKKGSDKDLETLHQYITKNKPSADFVKSWNLEIKYNPVRMFYVYAKQRPLYVRQAYSRNRRVWDDAYKRMLIDAPLMNELALSSWGYRVFIKMVLMFNKPQGWDDANYKEKFIKEWYANGSDTGERSYYKDELTIPNQKFIEKTFTGKVKEYLYAHLFNMALEIGAGSNLDSIYADFSKKYPSSIYKKTFGTTIAAVTEIQKRSINDRMIFETATLTTFDEVLNLYKGKTVLLDMWGTWCGPCRDELKNNSPAIKAYFKDKGLDYLYIANGDRKTEFRIKAWKSLITYLNMEGHHILATDELTNDIEQKIQLKGYPTYVIIHKDGSFEVSKARMSAETERNTLITEIEKALEEQH